MLPRHRPGAAVEWWSEEWLKVYSAAALFSSFWARGPPLLYTGAATVPVHMICIRVNVPPLALHRGLHCESHCVSCSSVSF
jgi:hypothetical protein